MTILASTIITEVERRLSDTNSANKRYEPTDYLDFLNKGQKMVAEAKPDVSLFDGTFRLVAGFDQSVPTGAKGLSKIDYNAGDDGTGYGKAITRIPLAELDDGDPAWRGMTATDEVQHYFYDPLNPKKFGVYPPNTGVQFVHGVCPVVPAVIANAGDNIGIADEYEESLINATIWYALADETDDAGMRVVRADALKFLELAIGVKVKTEEPAK